MADARGEVGTLSGLLDKSAQTGRAAGAHLVPQLFGGGNHLPQTTQGSFVRLAERSGRLTGNHRRQAENGLNLGNGRIARCRDLGDVIQGLAHDPFSHIARTFEQAADLQVDTRTELFDRSIAGGDGRIEGRQESSGDPPESSRRLRCLGGFDGADRFQHALARVGRRLRLLQPSQQALLEIQALRPQQVFHGLVGQGLRRDPLGRTQVQIRMKQIAGIGGRLATFKRQCLIHRQQTQRLIGFASQQIVEILAHTIDGLANDRCRVFADALATILDRRQQQFQRLGYLRHAIEPDDGQRAVHLMHMGAAELERRLVAAGLMLRQCVAGPLQGLVDFALDPGQRAQIKFRCRVHDLSR